MTFSTFDYATIAMAFVLAATLTPAVRAVARRTGMVAQPRATRWHTKPTALMGGAAIFAAMAIVWIVAGERSPSTFVLVACSAFMFLLGLIDDIVHLKPYQKFAGQIVAASMLTFTGWTLPWTPMVPVNVALTIFWLVGISNAINLLDNMDGLAAGVSLIAAGFLAHLFLTNGQHSEAVLLLSFVAVLAGFLIYNWNPASIFMGDCGSMFIGFFLASASLSGVSGGRFRTIFPVLVVPVLIFLIPIFDTTLVTVLRKLSGRAASQGGRDHTSHRLVALGLSERRAVLLIYGIALASGLLGVAVCELDLDLSLAVLAGSMVLLTLLGMHLGQVVVYDAAASEAARNKPVVAFLFDISYKRRIFEVLLDTILIVLSYYCAFTLLYGRLTDGAVRESFLKIVPLLVAVKLVTFLTLGVYRGMWRYFSIENLVVYAKAAVCGSAGVAIVALVAFRFQGFSRAVFVLDAFLTLAFLTGSRVIFRLLRSVLSPSPQNTASGRRVLIYGAGDGGELLLRELRNNSALRCNLVGFVDDDPLKKNKTIHGYKVFGGNGQLPKIVEEHRVDEIIVSSAKFTDERLAELRQQCDSVSVMLKRLSIKVEPLFDGGGG